MVEVADAKEQRPELERIRETCSSCLSEERKAYVVLGIIIIQKFTYFFLTMHGFKY